MSMYVSIQTNRNYFQKCYVIGIPWSGLLYRNVLQIPGFMLGNHWLDG